MAVIKPFRAFRYNQDLGWEPYMFLSPLKDVVSEAQINRLRSLPYNTIHLSQPLSTENACEKLWTWRHDGIITQDPLPAFYPFYQQFSLFGSDKTYTRKGFLAMVALNKDQDGEATNIIVHEGTVEASLPARTRFLECAKMNVIPVHGLYHDPTFTLEPMLDPYINDAPVLECFDEQGVRNKLGILQHYEQLHFITNFLKDKKIYLADGHHRLEASRRVRNLLADRQADYLLMYLSNMASDDLRILPTHRLVQFPENWNEERFLEKLEVYFHLEPFNKRSPIYEELKGQQARFGLVLPNSSHVLRLKEQIVPTRDVELPLPDSVKRLDYTILHYFILDRILGMPYAEQHTHSEISYIKDYSRAVKTVRESQEHFAVIVNEIHMNEMLAVCDDGARMPQKSTYFFPKVVTGFVFASINDADHTTPFDLSF